MKLSLVILAFLLFSSHAMAADSMRQLIAQNKFASAVQTGEQLLLSNPQQTNTRFLTAYANQMNGNTERAIELYEALIQDEPELPEPRNNLAMIYLARGDYDRASQLLISAINTRTSYAVAYANLSQVYKGIASEAYRRAISQTSEPAKYTHDIELTAITRLDSPEADQLPAVASLPQVKPKVLQAQVEKPPASESQPAPTPVTKADRDKPLIETVMKWASAWSNKDFDNYTAAYAPGYRSRFKTHARWVEHRRSRILRPGEITVEVGNFKVKRRDENRASVDFTQAFSSPTYSDRVIKRLDFERIGSQWKIAAERVLSVL